VEKTDWENYRLKVYRTVSPLLSGTLPEGKKGAVKLRLPMADIGKEFSLSTDGSELIRHLP
jgi:hypothetical protein